MELKKVMIVDDDEQLRLVIRSILEQEGYEVAEAESGQQSLDMLKAGEAPDLVLMDVMMPEMDGWETCRKIKENEDLKDTLVAMLTLKTQDDDKMESLGQATADWHIDKPINRKKFLKTVKWILRTPKD
jgi:CheY-like chemotaxis protein